MSCSVQILKYTGDGYATKSRNNYEITNKISNPGLVKTPEQLLQLNSLFAFDGDGVEGYGVALNKSSKGDLKAVS